MLFYRFISDNLTNYLNKEEQRAGNTNFDYSKLSDKDAEFARHETVLEKGFYIGHYKKLVMLIIVQLIRLRE